MWLGASLGNFYVCLYFALGFFQMSLAASEENFKCPEQFGYYPDFQDCSKYYVCVFGDSLHEKCTGGLFFSVELQTCDWPRNVECANGEKPGEPAQSFDADDEVFSSSRRTSATATGGRPQRPNPEPVTNHQPFENKDDGRNYPRNGQQQTQRTRTTSAATSSPETATNQPKATTVTTLPPSTRQKPESNPTTLSDRPDLNNGDNAPSTIADDPLYLSDERSKVSDPLSNYPQLPDFQEAAPPIIDSEGGIHIADGGHGLDAFAGLAHLPGLGDYSVIAKPVHNANSDSSERVEEDSDYNTRDNRKQNSGSRTQSAVSTKPRSIEGYQSNNGRQSDVLVDYDSGSKDLPWARPNSLGPLGTPPPTVFDDNSDHRDYGRFDIITPLKVNIQADHNPANGNSRVIFDGGNTETRDGRTYASESDEVQPELGHDVPRLSNSERNRNEDNRADKVIYDGKDQESARGAGTSGDSSRSQGQSTRDSNVAIIEEIPRLRTDNEGQTHPVKPVGYGTLTIYRPPEEHLKIVNEDSVQYRPNNRQSDSDDARGILASDGHDAFSEHDDQGQNSGRQQGQRNSNTDSSYHRKPRINEHRNPYPEITRNNGNSKDPDTSIPEHDTPDFGVYTGSQRQNRKIDVDNVGSKVIIPAESIQPSVRQPNQVHRDPQQKDHPDSNYRDEYENPELPRYGEYDSSKPLYTDDYYTSHEDQETTTRVTTQILRTRPTRPRKPLTTTTTTTTTTTPAPIRIRTRKPASQAAPPTKQPNYYATTPASPPSRPVSVYPTPPPYTTAQKCDPRKCKLPDCRCGGTDIPGGLSVQDIPQIVVLTFDDAVNDLNHDLYDEIFNSGRVNPNGCPILGTFYVSHEWTDYGQVQTLYANGHEIASHSITHSYGEKFSKNQWMREIHGQREILHLYGGVKMEDIRGMRAPFLQIGGNKMFEMLYDANFTYDSSMPVYENNPPFWPYTLDYALNHECMIFPCPTKSFPGLWEVGMVMWVDLRGGRCSMGDACSNPPDEEAVTKMLMKNFDRHYKSNKSPFGLFYHSAWFNTQHHRRGFMKFLDQILKKDDVYFVTNWQLIQWMRDPTPLSAIKDFEPFNCRRMDRPPPCPSPTVCNVWYQGGVRYMKTCQPCPVKYPWVGSTGYDAKNKG